MKRPTLRSQLRPSPLPGPIVGAGLLGTVMALGKLIAWPRRVASRLDPEAGLLPLTANIRLLFAPGRGTKG